MTRISRPESIKSPVASDQDSNSVSQTQARFGQINFINSLPLTLPLLAAKSFDKVSFTLATPSELNRGYSAGDLDLGAMSSFFFLERGGFKLIPSISIASKGAVGSVLFFANRDLKDLRSSVLSITADSATSVNLLKVLFAESYGFIPSCETSSKPVVDAERHGALVIGDKALHNDSTWSKDLVRVDLGQWWFETFGLPMVFGVWAAQNQWVSQNQPRFDAFCEELRQLFDRGLGSEFEAVLAEAQKCTGLSRTRLERYYKQELDFDLTDEHRKGLKLYASLCSRHGLLSPGRGGADID